MKKFTIVTATLMFCAFVTMAQNGELPPTYFNGSTNICDNSSWKLVFQDDFNGDTLKSPWITFISWRGMSGGDNDNWDEARSPNNKLSIFKDENVVVSNGIVKLKIKKESSSWHCATCPMQTLYTNYSSAALCLPYTLPFNNGKFEARIKMPNFKYEHSTFWLWYGLNADTIGVDEIDIVESQNKSYPHVYYNLHAWAPIDNGRIDPYNLPSDSHTGDNYPNQSWPYWIAKIGFRQDEFHTYTCEWDPNKINFFIDGYSVRRFWKYYRTETRYSGFWPFGHHYTAVIGAPCIPSAGNWKITKGYPWNDSSYSNLRFTTKIDQESDSHPDGFLGQMEIDYVKIWEKHPENGWVALCDAGDITITGSSEVCNNNPITYTASNPQPTGYWEVSPNLSIVSSNSSSVSVIYNGQPNVPGSDAGFVKYFPSNQNCPETNSPVFVKKAIVAGKLIPSNVVVSKTVHNSNQTYSFNLKALFSEDIKKAMEFGYGDLEWDIDYGPNYSNHYHASGGNVLTPPVPYNPNASEGIRWTLSVTNPCGTTVIHGENYYFGLGIEITSTATNIAATSQYYVAANITNDEDYQNLVQSSLNNTMLPYDASDTTAIEQLILEKKMEALKPYLVLDTVRNVPEAAMLSGEGNSQPLDSPSVLYPNPFNDFISLTIGNGYQMETPVELTISDNTDRVVYHKQINIENSNILTMDVPFLKEGIYFLNLRQNGKVEHFKLVKIKD